MARPHCCSFDAWGLGIRPLMRQGMNRRKFLQQGANFGLVGGCTTWFEDPNLVLSPRWANSPIEKSFFGLHINYLSLDNGTPFLNIGEGWVRGWDQFVTWREIEKSPGVYNWDHLDRIITILRSKGIDRGLYTLGQAPPWATPGEFPRKNSQYNPYVPDLRAWEQFLINLVQINKEKWSNFFDTFEMWNEVDNQEFYQGSTSDLVELCASANRIIKLHNPTATLLSPSFMTTGYERFTEFLSAKGHLYCDGIALHPYPDPQAPEEMIDILNRFSNTAQIRGIRLPIWVTECGYYYGYFLNRLKVTTGQMPEQMAGAYVVRLLLLSLIAGVEAFFFYSADAPVMKIRLWAGHGETLTVAGSAYMHAARTLLGARLKSYKHYKGVHTLDITPRSGGTTRVMWCDENTTRALRPPNSASITNIVGNSINARTLLTLTSSPIYLHI